ncbi:hypothetical protein C7974DRAFT_85820 [Boeremia exigua]|uniref:uncharacterized protein n=1 Tax=Boeremia exigua TaxID=749465 RepID=UPI001E8EDBA1|nr:uncharacterized protein C7974DRAFT_85820 [Boeremia exigua]KAH6611856.1 hypothetical protein C7974DRAFT_85820 [Boeremia exigua]
MMDQKKPGVAVEGVVADSKAYTARSRSATRHSQWPILLAIFCVLAASIGAALVVYLSDGKPTTSWKTRPSVLLAIIAPIITLSFAFLLSTAFSISWWRAAEAGTTIEHLNRIWDRGFWLRRSTWKTAVFSTNGFKRLAVVSLLVPIGNFLYNPLFQLSTTASHTGAEAETISLTLDILPEIPNGLASLSYTGSGARMDFTAAAVQWYRNDTIHTKDEVGYRCDGTCRGTVVAPGIVATCTSETTTMDLTQASTEERWFFRVNQTYERTADNYMVHVLRSTYTPETAQNCTSTVITETCVIEIGQVDYDIEIRGTQVSVLPKTSSQWVSNNISRTAPHDAPTSERPGPLWALGYMATYFGSWSGWEANATQMSTFGILSEQLYLYTKQGNDSLCISDYRWSNPTDYVLNGMGQTLFRLAMNGNSATNLTVLSAPNGIFPQPQTFSAYHTHEVIFYKSDFKWLGIALGAVLLSLLALSTILLGSRNISRTVTLSPVETFQVFPIEVQRTLLSRSNTGLAHRTEDILKHVGDTRVQYKPSYSPIETREP